jgi:hypothetical protein
VTGYTFGSAGTVTANAVQIDGLNYHSVTCAYTGNGLIATDFNQNPIMVNNVINPTTEKSRPVLVQTLSADGALIEQYSVLPSLNIGKVKVTATMQGELSMTIYGQPAGTNACNEVTTVNTTPVLIDFGSPTIGQFSVGAQEIEVNASLPSDYYVTLIQQDQMRRSGSTINACSTADGDIAGGINPDCITDIMFDSVSPTNQVSFTSANSQKGLGYSLGTVTSENGLASQAFPAGTYRQLADRSVGESPVEIYNGEGPTDYDRYHACYKLSIDAGLHAGTYENAIFYTLTATF